jgi:hypothetical protein
VNRVGALDAPLSYDVIDRTGKLTFRVVMPGHTRIIGFGPDGAIYAVRRDDSDLEYLQRYRLGPR